MVTCFLLGSGVIACADNVLLNPLNTFDITLSGQNYGAAFNADGVNTYYTVNFEANVGGVWTNVGSNGVYVTKAGAQNVSVNLANKPWPPGTSYQGRVTLSIAGVVANTKTGTFRD